jgi:hypothetical protein
LDDYLNEIDVRGDRVSSYWEKMFIYYFFDSHWNSAPVLSLAVIYSTTLSTPNQSARQIEGDFKCTKSTHF